jgi:DNA-3-methyladenine glycosylase
VAIPPEAISSNSAYRPRIVGRLSSDDAFVGGPTMGGLSNLADGHTLWYAARASGLFPMPSRPPKLGEAFYARPVLTVARDSIGKVLVCRTPEGTTRGRIVEAEAYRGPEDRAAHSHGGRRTTRTEVMFGPPGHAYVFLLYGMHWHFNMVTGGLDEPEAVLIRAVEPLSGKRLMAARRGLSVDAAELTNGPGKLCRAMGIDKRHNGQRLTGGDLYLEDAPRCRVARTTRVGVAYAGTWADKPWRFYDPESRYVSRRPRAI